MSSAVAVMTLVTALTVATAAPAASPRPPPGVLMAVPEDARAALFLEQHDGALVSALEWLARLLGASAVEEFLDQAPLPLLALRTTENRWVTGLEPKGGLGIFQLPDFAGSVGLVRVKDGPLALNSVVTRLRQEGAKVHSKQPNLIIFAMPDGTARGALLEKGHLYLVMPKARAGDGAFAPLEKEVRAVTQRLVKARGLGTGAVYTRVASKVAPGDLSLYLRAPASADSDLQAALFSVVLGDDGADLDGYALVKGALWPAAPASSLSLEGPGRGVVELEMSAPLPRVLDLALGNPGTPRRLLRERQLGLTPGGLAAFTGDLRLHLRPGGNVAAPTPWALSGEVGATDPLRALDALGGWLGPLAPVVRLPAADGGGLVASLLGQPLVVLPGASRLRLVGGQAGPEQVPAGAGPLGLARGHLSLRVDLGQLPRGTLLDLAPRLPFERAALLVFPEGEGLRVSGTLMAVESPHGW